MKIRTHLNLARITMNKIEKSNSDISYTTLGKLAFYIGTMTPDLSVRQFLHPHFYDKSADYIFSKINKLSDVKLFTVMNMYELGNIVHYLSDFCCYVHASGGVGNVSEHMKYERKINRYLLRNFTTYKKILSKFSQRQIHGSELIEKLKSMLSDYRIKKPGLHIDVSNALEISTTLCLSL